MNKFKVGDVVWWYGHKVKIVKTIGRHYAYGGEIFLVSFGFIASTAKNIELKPIKREYAILGDACAHM